ncbi:hypothetical protein CP533_0487 [Ophiocordyceps camponoti-saundersi (nom. inval.)]|nr:hypothetical protein CP533_0487 [Ophiocordyceps camponoti-saundersi (nom. inval.)]
MVTPVPLDGALSDDTVAGMVRRGVGVIPTLASPRRATVERRISQAAYDHAMTAASHHALARRPRVPRVKGATSYGSVAELTLLETDGGMSRAELLRTATSTPAAQFRLDDRSMLKEDRRADMNLLRGSPRKTRA